MRRPSFTQIVSIAYYLGQHFIAVVGEGICVMRADACGASMGDVEVAHVLSRAVLRLARRLRAERANHGLSSTAVGVLAHLRLEGPSTPGAIAKSEQHRPQSLTRVLADLERQGLLARAASLADGRQSLLSLTPAGAKALSAELAIREAWMAQALQALSPAERRTLATAAPVLDALSRLP